jgi:hypothetical protein
MSKVSGQWVHDYKNSVLRLNIILDMLKEDDVSVKDLDTEFQQTLDTLEQLWSQLNEA